MRKIREIYSIGFASLSRLYQFCSLKANRIDAVIDYQFLCAAEKNAYCEKNCSCVSDPLILYQTTVQRKHQTELYQKNCRSKKAASIFGVHIG